MSQEAPTLDPSSSSTSEADQQEVEPTLLPDAETNPGASSTHLQEEGVSNSSHQQVSTGGQDQSTLNTTPALEHRQVGICLRSGTILPDPSAQVSVNLDTFLNNIVETAQEPTNSSTPLTGDYIKKYEKDRQQRAAQTQEIREYTERVKNDLTGLSRSLILLNSIGKNISNRNSVSLRNNSEGSESEINEPAENTETDAKTEALARSCEQALVDCLHNSLNEIFNEQNTHFKNLPNFTINTMVDYPKVVKLTAQLVPTFSGAATPQLGRELQTFIGCCRQTIQCLNDEEKQAFVPIMLTRLRGDAYQLFVSDVPTTFEAVEERLNRAYLPRESYQDLVNKLVTARQNPLETLDAFTNRVKQLLTLCEESATIRYGATTAPAVKTQLQDFAKNSIKSGVINPHLCQYLLALDSVDLDTLIEKALDMEKLQKSAVYVQTPATQNSPPAFPEPLFRARGLLRSPYRGFVSELPNRHTPHVATSPPNIRPPFRPRDSRHVTWAPTPNTSTQNITCTFCQKRGHTYTDCLKRKNTPYCVTCKIYGHDVLNCGNNRPRSPSTSNFQRGAPNRPPQQPQTSNGSRQVFNIKQKCKFCGRRGHVIEDCRQRQKWEKRSQGNDQESTQNSPDRL